MGEGTDIMCEWCSRTYSLGRGDGQFGDNGAWFCAYCLEALDARDAGKTVGECAQCHGPVIGAVANQHWVVICKRCIQERIVGGGQNG